MKRTAEKVLAIISAVFTGISIILSFMFVSLFKTFNSDEAIRLDLKAELVGNQGFTNEEANMVMSMIDGIESFSWGIIVLLFISLIATIVGIVFIWNDKNPKLAGAMFIIGGLFTFVLSLTSILLYIAGILSFTRKPPLQSKSDTIEDGYGGTMRPL